MKKLSFIISCFAILSLAGQNVSAYAQGNIEVQHTENPREYVFDLLTSISKEGVTPLRNFLRDAGYSNLQIEQTLSTMGAYLETDQKSTIKIIEEIDNAGIMRQVYAYSHLGKNAWFFWRIDFMKTGDGWAMANFAFNSDYTQVLAPKFETNVVVE